MSCRRQTVSIHQILARHGDRCVACCSKVIGRRFALTRSSTFRRVRAYYLYFVIRRPVSLGRLYWRRRKKRVIILFEVLLCPLLIFAIRLSILKKQYSPRNVAFSLLHYIFWGEPMYSFCLVHGLFLRLHFTLRIYFK